MRLVVCLVTTFGAVAALAATTAGAVSGSSCRSNDTYQQAVQGGDLPAIVAALHGGAGRSNTARLICVTAKR